MATTTTRSIAIRLGLIDADKVQNRLVSLGDTGERALRKVKDAAAPASRSLIAINAVSQEVHHGMQNLASSAGSVGSVLARLGPVGLAVAAVIATLTLATAKGIKEFKEAEQATNLLTAALQTTGNAAGVTVREIQQLGEAVEETTLFKKEDILKAAAALTSYGNIQDDVFKRALVLATDLATRLGGDVETAADQLGAALENPEKGLGRLDKKYQDLLISQKDSIDAFIKQGDVASAQRVILDALESKSKDLAESQAQGLTGAANKLSDAWDNLLESFGNTINESGTAQASLSALTFIVEKLNKAVDNSPLARKKQLESEISDLSGSFGTRLDEFVLGSAPGLEAKKRELQEINRKLAEEEKKAADEKAEALKAADLRRAEDRNEALLGIEKEYQKKSKDAALTEREKLLEEAKQTKERIDTLFKDDRNSGAAQGARAAVDANLKAQLAKLDKPEIERRGQEKTATRNRAIEELNRGILQTKPSFDLAKQALDDWKTRVIEDLGGATEANQQYIGLVEEIYAVKLKDIYNKSLLDSDKWEDGASRALSRYADEATNAAKNAEELFGGAARKVEDTLVDMVSSGEISFSKIGDLIQSLEQDILRMFLRENVTGPIAKGLSGLLGGGSGGGSGGSGGGIFGSFFSDIFSSLFHDGGVVGASSVSRRAVPAYAFAGAPRLHSGLMPDEFPAILQRGETVLPKNKKMGSSPQIVMNITTANAQSFMDSQGQIMSRLAGQMQRFRARNS